MELEERLPQASGMTTATESVGTGEDTLPSIGQISPPVTLLRRSSIIASLSGITAISALCSGMLTVALPRIAKDIKLSTNLLLWPASVFGLAAGCTLLIFGALADVIGPKKTWLAGTCLYAVFTLACGFAKTGFQLIIFRVLTGIAIAMCLPTAVSITTKTFPSGRARNVAFAAIGMGQPLGFSIGLVLGGAFVNTIGWRYGFYLSAVAVAALAGAGIWALPQDENSEVVKWERIRDGIDWIGAFLVGISFGLLSFVLGIVSVSYTNIRKPEYIVLLCIAILLLPVFMFWVARQEKLGRPALIPNSIWKSPASSSTCASVFLSWAAFTAIQYFFTLYFQLVQDLSAIEASTRLLPQVIVGVSVNICTGYLADKVNVLYLVVGSGVITAIGPLLMAFAQSSWSYWQGAFIGEAVAPLSPDVLFTVSNLIIASAFSREKQSLAGGVVNSISQMGYSIGLGVCAAIAASVTEGSYAPSQELPSPEQLMYGYRAAFWTIFASTVLVCFITFWGLRKTGKVGRKQD